MTQVGGFLLDIVGYGAGGGGAESGRVIATPRVQMHLEGGFGLTEPDHARSISDPSSHAWEEPAVREVGSGFSS